MTMVRGVRIVAAPCCGAQYALPNYMSMNFSAFAFWTDAWRDGSLMPNDEGLRRCACGQFFLLKDTKAIEDGCRRLDIPLYETEGANHSLETGDVEQDIKELRKIMKAVREYAEKEERS